MIAIYSISSPSGRIYIGKSMDVQRRFRHYREGRIRTQRLLMNSLKKYGWEKHVFRIEEEHIPPFDNVFTSRREIEFISAYRSVGAKLLNLTNGGEGNHGLVMSDAAKAKLRAKALGRKQPDSAKLKLSKFFKGRPKSAIHRQRISESNKGGPGWKGRKHTFATRLKMSLAHKGKIFSSIHIQHLRDAQRKRFLK